MLVSTLTNDSSTSSVAEEVLQQSRTGVFQGCSGREWLWKAEVDSPREQRPNEGGREILDRRKKSRTRTESL